MEFNQEPFVDISHLPDLVDAISAMERGGNGKNPFVSWIDELLVNILHIIILFIISQTVLESDVKDRPWQNQRIDHQLPG